MNQAFTHFVRVLALMVFIFIGGSMALVFLASTAIAIGILYVIAKLRGRPLGMRTYWQRHAPKQRSTPQQRPYRTTREDVVDVDAREVH
jgi:NhaP-type Na+/H+ or K+/H+ antiporter